jgi:hypothetical protein
MYTYNNVCKYLSLLDSIAFVNVGKIGSSSTLEIDARVAALLNDINEALVLTYEALDVNGPPLASNTVYTGIRKEVKHKNNKIYRHQAINH